MTLKNQFWFCRNSRVASGKRFVFLSQIAIIRMYEKILHNHRNIKTLLIFNLNHPSLRLFIVIRCVEVNTNYIKYKLLREFFVDFSDLMCVFEKDHKLLICKLHKNSDTEEIFAAFFLLFIVISCNNNNNLMRCVIIMRN